MKFDGHVQTDYFLAFFFGLNLGGMAHHVSAQAAAALSIKNTKDQMRIAVPGSQPLFSLSVRFRQMSEVQRARGPGGGARRALVRLGLGMVVAGSADLFGKSNSLAPNQHQLGKRKRKSGC